MGGESSAFTVGMDHAEIESSCDVIEVYKYTDLRILATIDPLSVKENARGN